MLPWLVAKFVGNFVLESGFPLLFNTFNTDWVPLLNSSDAENTVPRQLYLALYWFPLMAAGDTISRRLPQYLSLSHVLNAMYITVAIILCVGGESLYLFLTPIVTGIGVFIANFGNGFIYGLSAKYIDMYIPEEHRYAAYNLWCFVGDISAYVGQCSVAVYLADIVCGGREYRYVCHPSPLATTTTVAPGLLPVPLVRLLR